MPKGDERILGDSLFVLNNHKEAEEKFERRYAFCSRGLDLDQLVVRVANIFGIEARD